MSDNEKNENVTKLVGVLAELMQQAISGEIDSIVYVVQSSAGQGAFDSGWVNTNLDEHAFACKAMERELFKRLDGVCDDEDE